MHKDRLVYKKMREKILLYSMDPGGANTIIPLVSPLKQRKYNVRLFGDGQALEKYKQFRLKGTNLSACLKNSGPAEIKQFLKQESPDFIITSTSANDFTERYIWKAAESLNIPSFAIIDQWINYGIRFSDYKVSDIEKYNKSRQHHYLPSRILIMDEFAKKEAIQSGLEASRLMVTGQPYFGFLMEQMKRTTKTRINYLRKKLGLDSSDYVITFASEPISKDYNSGASKSYWGFDQETILKEVIQAVTALSPYCKRKNKLIIKKHPREAAGSCSRVIRESKGAHIIILNKNIASWELIAISNVVLGMSSMFLIESVILGKPTLSITIGLKGASPFVLDRYGIMPSIRTRQLFKDRLKKIIIEKELNQYRFKVDKNAVENIIMVMERHLCLN